MVIPDYSLAYDGLFQMTMGWGPVQVPEEYAKEAEELYRSHKDSIGLEIRRFMGHRQRNDV